MPNAELATGIIRLMPSARGFRDAVDRELGPDLAKSGERAGDDTSRAFGRRFNSGIKTIGKAGALAFGATFTGAAILGKQSIDAASDLEETQNKVNVVFGDGADIINDWAKGSSSALGQSRRQALDSAGTFGNLFTQLGIGSETAAGMSTQMVGLASDFASFHNADISEVLQAQQAAFRGEYDAVQRFVPTINAAAVEQRAMEMGLAGSTKELDAQDKALATQALLVEGAGQATGDFARTSGGLANQQRILGARFEDAKASIGTALIPAMTAVVTVISEKVVPWVQELAEKWMPYLRAGFENVSDWVRENWPQIRDTAIEVFENVKSAIQDAVDIIRTIWENFGDQLTSIGEGKFKYVLSMFQNAFKTISGIFETFSALFRGDWSGVWEGLQKIFSGVIGNILAIFKESFNTLKNVLSIGMEILSAAWRAAWEGIVNFFRDNVFSPISGVVGNIKDTIVNTIQAAVDRAKSIWNGLTAIVTFLDTYVATPIRNTIDTLKTFLGNVFENAVDAVKTAWDKLKDIVKKPINVVIGFYNDGIRKVWNSVISKIPGIGDLGEISMLNRGGWVPGSGNKDTVPILGTPGEYMVRKPAAQAWGPGVMELINRGPSGTIDPAILGYAAGGYVRSADEALAWARSLAGKPYRFPDVGPDSFDCSGFTSALLNYILGVNPPWRRRHSSGTVGGDPALRSGAGDEALGLLFGARPPYMTNAQGASVGHIAATLAGVNMEATPPAVRVGGGARGARNAMFTGLWHLPGYGGLSDSDKGIASSVQGLKDMAVSGLTEPLGDLLQKMINRLPGMVFDYFIKKLPGAIVDAIVGGIGGLFKAVTPFGEGGTAWHSGPALYGEYGPELGWSSKGMYIQATEDLARGRRQPIEVHNHYHTREPTATEISGGIRMAQLRSAG